mmetsp:Transcript_34763/g.51038  ORF Transcript_34763/g.51038 Transcript_34763/m.51038 type:complete len:272 (+) Transcript_34763:596-1411(+)
MRWSAVLQLINGVRAHGGVAGSSIGRDIGGGDGSSSCVVFLEPETEFQAVVQRLILPRDVLVGIQEGPHVMAAQLPSRIRAQIACRVLHGHHVSAGLVSAVVAAANRRSIGVLESSKTGAERRRCDGANAEVITLGADGKDCDFGCSLGLVVRQCGRAAHGVDEVQQHVIGGIEGEVVGRGTLQSPSHDDGALVGGSVHSVRCDRDAGSELFSGILVGEFPLGNGGVGAGRTGGRLDHDRPRRILHLSGVEANPEPHVGRAGDVDGHEVVG